VWVGAGNGSEEKIQKWNNYSAAVCQVTALAAIDAWKAFKMKRSLVSLGPDPGKIALYPVIVKKSGGTNAGICKPI